MTPNGSRVSLFQIGSKLAMASGARVVLMWGTLPGLLAARAQQRGDFWDTNSIIQPSGCGYRVPAYLAPGVGTLLPAFWAANTVTRLLLLDLVSAAALATGISSRRRCHRSERQQTGDVVIWTPS